MTYLLCAILGVLFGRIVIWPCIKYKILTARIQTMMQKFAIDEARKGKGIKSVKLTADDDKLKNAKVVAEYNNGETKTIWKEGGKL